MIHPVGPGDFELDTRMGNFGSFSFVGTEDLETTLTVESIRDLTKVSKRIVCKFDLSKYQTRYLRFFRLSDGSKEG